MTRVDHGDGTFSYVPPPGLSYADQVGNHFTWRYVGQAVHSDAPQPILGVTEYVDGVDIPDDPSEGVAGLLGATRVDGYGRIWEIVAIDSPALDAAVVGYYAAADVDAGPQPVPQGPDHSQPFDEALGVGDTWPNAADSRNCDGVAGNDMLIIDGDDRTGFSAPVTHTESSLLHLRISIPGSGSRFACSGTKVSDRHVLTAAHCLVDSAGNLLPNVAISVCSNQTASAGCQTLAGTSGTVLLSGSFAPGATANLGDARDDWALVTMPGGLPDPKMFLADGAIGRSEIRKLSAERVGHDGFKPMGSTQCASVTYQMHEPSTPVSGTNRGTVRFKGDAAVGASGGPYFVVPPGLTAGRILGVHSMSHAGPVSMQVGARVTEFRGAVIGVIED